MCKNSQTATHTHTHAHTHTRTRTHTHARTQTNRHRHTDTQTQTHRHSDTQTHRHIDTRTRTHTHTICNLQQKKNKATGPDGIKAEVLHHLVGELSPFLCRLLNECLLQGRIPSGFKEANMVVLSKGDDKDNIKEI